MGTCMTCNMEVKSVDDKFSVSGDSREPLETGTTSEEAWYIRCASGVGELGRPG